MISLLTSISDRFEKYSQLLLLFTEQKTLGILMSSLVVLSPVLGT